MRRGKRMDVETILLCAVIAVAGAVGVVAGAAAFLGVSLGNAARRWSQEAAARSEEYSGEFC